MLFLLFIIEKCYHQKEKKKIISLVVICDLVPMFSKTETDTLRSPPFKNWGPGLLKFSCPISEPQCVCVKISDSDPPTPIIYCPVPLPPLSICKPPIYTNFIKGVAIICNILIKRPKAPPKIGCVSECYCTIIKRKEKSVLVCDAVCAMLMFIKEGNNLS